MEEQDKGSKDQEDIESTLAKAAFLEKDIITLIDNGCITGEKYYSKLVFWLKGTGLFDGKDAIVSVIREKLLKRNTKKPINLWNNTDIEIQRICDSVNAAVFRGGSFTDKFEPAGRWLSKIQSLLTAGKSEILNLKKKHSEEIEELEKVLEGKKHEIILLKDKKHGAESAEERKTE